MGRDPKKKVVEKVIACPRCRVDMTETRKEGTFLDECPRCSGVFFDQGEMFAALGATADPSYWDRPETGGNARPGNIHCPRCKGEMMLQDVAYGGDHVEIDRCGECQGIWLDKGESDKIMAIGAKLEGVVKGERDAAQVELDKMGDVDFRSGGIIHSFLSLFRGKKKS
jgi:Zn-finger nucleic acid-binding protein